MRSSDWSSDVCSSDLAADIALFRPIEGEPHEGDLVWIGNWGDDERTAELQAYLLQPAAALGLRARIYGVRYPEAARRAVADAGEIGRASSRERVCQVV